MFLVFTPGQVAMLETRVEGKRRVYILKNLSVNVSELSNCIIHHPLMPSSSMPLHAVIPSWGGDRPHGLLAVPGAPGELSGLLGATIGYRGRPRVDLAEKRDDRG